MTRGRPGALEPCHHHGAVGTVIPQFPTVVPGLQCGEWPAGGRGTAGGGAGLGGWVCGGRGRLVVRRRVGGAGDWGAAGTGPGVPGPVRVDVGWLSVGLTDFLLCCFGTRFFTPVFV